MIKNVEEKIRFTVDLDPDLHRELKLLAVKEKCRATEVVRYALLQLFAKHQEKKTVSGPASNPDSKRNSPDWESFTAFCHPSTKTRLQHLTHLFKTAGFGPQDQSEALDEALTQWMNTAEPLVRQAIRNQMENN